MHRGNSRRATRHIGAPDDFAPDANRPEAWRCEYHRTREHPLERRRISSGGDLSLSIDVYDWFNADANLARVESPGNFAMEENSIPSGGGEGYSTYEIDIIDATPTAGAIDMLISIESDESGYGGLLPGKAVTSYFIYTSGVSDQTPFTPGWARTWGGSSLDYSYDCSVDGDGNVLRHRRIPRHGRFRSGRRH